MRAGGISPTCPTRPSWRCRARSRVGARASSTTGSAGSPTGSPTGSCATRRSPRTPCRRASSRSGGRRRASCRSGRRRAPGCSRSSTGAPSTSCAARSDGAPSRSRPSGVEAGSRRTAEDSALLRLERERVQAALRQAPGRAARGDRARVLRRLHAVGAGRAARPADRHHQEPDVRRARAAARAPRRRHSGRDMEDADSRADGRLRARRARRGRARAPTRRTSPGCDALPGRARVVLAGDRLAGLRSGRPAPAPSPELRGRLLERARAERPNVVPLRPRRWVTAGGRGCQPRPRLSWRSGSGSGRRRSRATSTTRRALADERAVAQVLADPNAHRWPHGRGGPPRGLRVGHGRARRRRPRQPARRARRTRSG